MFFRKESSILIPGFDKSDLSRLKNSFTNEPLWVVTHTACLQRKYQRPNQARRNFNYRWLGFLSYNTEDDTFVHSENQSSNVVATFNSISM